MQWIKISQRKRGKNGDDELSAGMGSLKQKSRRPRAQMSSVQQNKGHFCVKKK